MAGTKEPWSDTIGRVVWNVTAPVTDDGGGIIKGTGIKAGQEVLYSKIIRKILSSRRRLMRGWARGGAITSFHRTREYKMSLWNSPDRS